MVLSGEMRRIARALKRALYRCAPNSLLNWLVRRRLPRIAILEATTACNLECPLCPTHYVPRGSRFLTASEVQNVIDSSRGALETVCFHIQGEPTVHPELFDFVRRCTAAGVKSWFGTNGMHLDRHLDDIFEAGLDVISIDIDGANAEDYQKYRRRGDFDRVVSNTRALIEEKRRRGSKKPFIQVQTIMFTYNEEREDEIAEFHASFGADRTLMKRPSYFHDIEEGKRKGLVITERAQQKADEGARDFLTLVDPEREGSKYSRPKVVREEDLLRNQRLCPQLEKASVLSDGRVVACCMDGIGMTEYGVLKQQEFREIWRGERHREVLRAFLERRLGICETCTLGVEE